MQAGLPSPASAWRAWLHATSPGRPTARGGLRTCRAIHPVWWGPWLTPGFPEGDGLYGSTAAEMAVKRHRGPKGLLLEDGPCSPLCT